MCRSLPCPGTGADNALAVLIPLYLHQHLAVWNIHKGHKQLPSYNTPNPVLHYESLIFNAQTIQQFHMCSLLQNAG